MSSETGKPASQAKKSKKFDLIHRGSRKATPIGSLTFVGLRALDIPLQHAILARGLGSSLLQKMHLTQLPAGLPTHTGTLIDALNLSPYRLILLSMATGSALKQIYWQLFISYEEFPPSAAAAVSVYNSLFNAVNNLLFTTTLASASLASNQAFPQWPLVAGVLSYITGMTLELVSEAQRRRFKEDPANAGKVCKTGLWRYARHINYTGYSLWRAGFTTAAAGFGAGAVVLLGLLADFNLRAIPVLDEYCGGRYGEQWDDFKRQTPYKLVPGVI